MWIICRFPITAAKHLWRNFMPKNIPNAFTSARLELHALRQSDIGNALSLFTNAEVAKTYMLPEFKSEDDAKKLFNRILEISNTENRFVYGIYLDDTFIGILNEVDKSDSDIELGYAIHPSQKNKGFATEALTAAIRVLFDIGYSTVKAGAFAENAASIRVMEKSGMKRTNQDEEIEYRGRIHPCINFEICKEGSTA